MEWKNNSYTITTELSKVDINFLHQILSNSYWASTRTKDQIITSIGNSICFSVFTEGKQIGFARVVTDKAVFGYIADVIIEPEYRGKGVGTWLLSCLLQYPDLVGTKLLLETQDAHDFYERFGFERKECMKRVLSKDG